MSAAVVITWKCFLKPNNKYGYMFLSPQHWKEEKKKRNPQILEISNFWDSKKNNNKGLTRSVRYLFETTILLLVQIPSLMETARPLFWFNYTLRKENEGTVQKNTLMQSCVTTPTVSEFQFVGKKHSLFLVRKWVGWFSRLNILGTLLKNTHKVTSCLLSNEKLKKNWLGSITEPDPVIFALVAYFFNKKERWFSRGWENDRRLNILGTLLKNTQKVTSCLLSNEKLKKHWLGSITQGKSHVLCFLPTNGRSKWDYKGACWVLFNGRFYPPLEVCSRCVTKKVI